MLFGIDFDGVFGADPALFRRVVALLREAGHDCVLVTGRSADPPWGTEVREAVGELMPIVFAAGGWKRAAAESAGHSIDVWIDDQPEYIAPQTDQQALAMRKGK